MTFSVRPGTYRVGLVLAVILCLALVSVIPVSAGWSYEVVGSMYPWTPGTELPGQVSGTITSHPFSLVVGSDGNSRISYLDENQHLAYAERMNGKWTTSTVDATIPAGASSLALTHNNVPGISYYDTKARGLMYAYKLYGSWKTESVEGNWAGPYSSLVYNEYGLPMVSYYSEGTSADLQVQKFAQRDPNQWYRKTPEGGAAGMFTALALNATGSPVIGLYDAGSKRLKYVYRADKGKWTEDPWVADRVVDSGNVGQYLSLAIDSKNILHFSYYNETGKSLKYAEGKSAGVDVGFNLVTVDTGNAGKYTSLALDSSGTPHISYWDDSRQILKYAVRNADGTWKKSEIWPWHSGTTQLPVSSLAIGPDNVPRISYIEYFDGTANLIYAEWVPDEPSPDIVAFGDTRQLVKVPLGTDYRIVGGFSAIRRIGSLETFTGGFSFPSSGWVDVTNGAAITANGDLATWKATARSGPVTFTPASKDKRYVSISQYSDGEWLLAIYKDASGATHLEASGNPAKHPEVFGNVPTDSGWKLIAAGKDHALAVRSNGSLVAWGKNNVGQLDLPNSATYTDVAAGYDFSIGLAAGNTGTSEYLYAAGRDDYGQVSKAPKDPAPFIQIAAGPTTGAALTHNGHILIWGKNLTGAPVPTDGGYTAISLGPDLGFALRDYAPELHITGPLSPDTNVVSREGTTMHIPKGALFEHTGNGVMRVIAPNGTVLFWVNDDEAAQVTFPEGTTFPSSAIHYLPKTSLILVPENYEAAVYGQDAIISDFLRLAEQPPLMALSTSSWLDEQNASSQQLTPQGVCFADTGCSVGATSRGELFLSKPQVASDGGIPVFSVQKYNDTMYVGRLSTLGSTDPANDRLVHIEKDRIDPNQPVKFNIVTGNGSVGGTNVVVMAAANLTNQSSVLHYTITATASQVIPAMNITPNIWKKTDAGDVLVFTGGPVKCSSTTICQATGDYTPADGATYIANATVLYTVPAIVNGIDGEQNYAIATSDVKASDTEVPYYLYAEAGGIGTESVASKFYDTLKGKSGANNIKWYAWQNSRGEEQTFIGYSDAKANHWKKTASSGISDKYIERADFAYYSGHGSPRLIAFDNEAKDATASDMSLGSGKLKWAVLDSCESLNQSGWEDWKSSFNGLHILLGWNTSTTVHTDNQTKDRGEIFVNLMQGDYPIVGTSKKVPVVPIMNAWDLTCQYSWEGGGVPDSGANRYSSDDDIFSGAIYDTNCNGDYLPGWGSGTACTSKSGTLAYYSRLVYPKTKKSLDNLKSQKITQVSGKYTLNITIPEYPEKIVVYSVVKPDYTYEWASSLADNLGLPNEILDMDSAFYAGENDAKTNYFAVHKDTATIAFQKFGNRVGMPLSETKSKAIVDEFLQKNSLIHPDALEPQITYNIIETIDPYGTPQVTGKTSVVSFPRTLNGLTVWNSQLQVELDSDGNVVGIFSNWRDYAPYKEYKLKSMKSAFRELQNKSFAVNNVEPDQVVITDVTLGYYSHAAIVHENYLQPVYVFGGYTQTGNAIQSFDPVYVYATDEILEVVV